MTMKSIRKNNMLIISCLVIALTIIKLYFYIPIKTPIIMCDEGCYIGLASNFAREFSFYSDNFFGKNCLYPAGYSTILSVAFFIYPSFYQAFDMIKLINCLVSSLVIVPTYLIFRELLDFKDRKALLLLALAVSTIPSVIGYFFWIMSENLFTLLVLFIFFLLIKLTKSENSKIALIFGFLNFYAFFTRDIGIAINLASLLSLIVFLRDAKVKYKKGIKILSSYLLGYLIPLIVWLGYRSQIRGQFVAYNTSGYLGAVIFDDFNEFSKFLNLFFNEILYIFVVTFIIFGILAFWKLFEFIKDSRKRSLSVFVFISLISFLVVTTAHMYLNLGKSEWDYNVLGRYIDPLMPLVYILGFVKLLEYLRYRNIRKSGILSILTIFMLFLIYFKFPVDNYKPPNTVAIYYLKTVGIDFFIWITLAMFLILNLFGYKIKYRASFIIIIFLVIIVNIFLTSHYYDWYLRASDSKYKNTNEIIKELKVYNENEFYMLHASASRPFYYSMWAIPKTIVSIKPEEIWNIDRPFILITDCPIPKEDGSVELNVGDRLYRIHDTSAIQFLVKFYNFYYPEKWGRWSPNDSAIEIYSSKNSVGLLKLKLSSFYKPRDLEIYANDKLILQQKIPSSAKEEIEIVLQLKKGVNKIRFFTPDGCQRPSDIPELKNPDKRCLSFAVFELSINSLEPWDYLDVGTEKAERYLLKGWSHSEKSGNLSFVWANDLNSSIAIVLEKERPLNLSFRCAPFSFNESVSQVIHVFFNGNYVTSLSLKRGWSEYNVSVPLEFVKEGINLLEFRYKYAERPKDHGINNDTRRLAVAFDWIKINN